MLSGFDGTSVLIELVYDRRRIADEAAGRMLRHLLSTLDGMIADPLRSLGKLPILAPDEQRRLVIEWNDTARPLPRARLHPWIVRGTGRADARGNGPRIRGDARLTYHELNVRGPIGWRVACDG